MSTCLSPILHSVLKVLYDVQLLISIGTAFQRGALTEKADCPVLLHLKGTIQSLLETVLVILDT